MWWIIVSLIIAGIILMLVEMLLIPGVGLAGFLSFASLVGACWYAFTMIGTKAGIIVTSMVVVVLVVMLIFMLREKTWKRFELKTEIDTKTNEDGQKVSVGQQGTTLTRLAPMGTARFDGQEMEVKSDDNSMVNAGVQIEVVRIEDNKIIVKTI